MNMSTINNYLVLMLSLTLFSLGCSSSDEPNSELPTVIFGHFFGECSGERCLETYMLQGESLFEDTNDSFTRDYNFVSLADSLYLRVNDLRDLIPAELSDLEGQTFGCPDCGDQGGVYLQLADQNDTEFFIDMDTNGIPDYLSEFVAEVNERIALLP